MPAVSIVLPTYNRARFLPQAFASICDQTFQDWELIVVDDGSTDDTRDLVDQFANRMGSRIRYVYQENRGAYPARDTGLRQSTGEFIAFFDSDDVWLPHHLSDCVHGLRENPEVDWVYGASRIVDHESGRTLAENSFYEASAPRPFLRLKSRAAGKLRIVEDAGVIRCMILSGLYCGLQNSVIRRNVLEQQPFVTEYWNEAEDQLIVIRCLAAGHRIAYLNQIHVIYNVHDANSCATGKSLQRSIRVHQACIRGFEDLGKHLVLGRSEAQALKRRLNREYFWHLGYSLLWRNGIQAEALEMYRKGLREWPWDWRCWKTFALAYLRTTFQHGRTSRALHGI